MKYSAIIIWCFLSCTAILSGAVTANLVITLPEGENDPQSPADGAPNFSFGNRGILRFTIEGGTGNVMLDSQAGNSSVPEIKAYGDMLDVLGNGNYVPGSPLSYVPEIDEMIVITITGELPDGSNARLKADSGLGFAVAGGNPTRIDWRFDNTNSEAIRFEVDATALPATHRLIITSLIFGNGNGMALPLVTDFSGGRVVGNEFITLEGQTALELSSAHELVGGEFGQLWLRQAVKAEQGDYGFSLQGISLEVLPYYGGWAGYLLSNEAGDTITRTLLGSINTGYGDWVWSHDLGLWFYMKEAWVARSGSWAYLPTNSMAALGTKTVVETDWLYLHEYAEWIYYKPVSMIGESGSWVFFQDL